MTLQNLAAVSEEIAKNGVLSSNLFCGHATKLFRGYTFYCRRRVASRSRDRAERTELEVKYEYTDGDHNYRSSRKARLSCRSSGPCL